MGMTNEIWAAGMTKVVPGFPATQSRKTNPAPSKVVQVMSPFTHLHRLVLTALLLAGLRAEAQEHRRGIGVENPFDSLFNEVQRTHINSSPTLLTWPGQFPGVLDPDAPMATDRPDVTEASSTVGPGVLQIETGYTYSREGSGSNLAEAESFPEALFRYGTPINWLELRLATSMAREKTVLDSSIGAEDLYLGAKIGLTLQDGILPEMALVPQMTVPSGSNNFSDDAVLPGVNWLYGWDINDLVSTAGSTQLNRSIDSGTGSSYAEWTQTWTVGYSLHDRIGAYTEWFAFIPQDADTARTEHYANGGFTVSITDDIQWDIRAGTGLNDNAADFFAGTGLSFRFR